MIPHRRIDDARGDAVYANAVLGKFQRHRLSDRDHRCLGRAVDRNIGLAAPTRLRGEVDDRPAAARLHARDHSLADEDRSTDVHVILAAVILLRDLFQRAHVEDAGIVDEDVDPAKRLFDPRYPVLDRRVVSHVHRHCYRAVPQRCGSFAGILFQHVRHGDRRAFTRVGLADRTADTARAAGDKGCLAVQPFHSMRRPLSSNLCRKSGFGVRNTLSP